jgi:hypothetical protein
MFRKVLLFSCLLILFTALALPAQALAGGSNSASNDELVFGGNFTLRSGQTLNGDLVVFGGSATLEDGSLVTGNIVLIGGNVLINGTIEGSVVGIGGCPTLASTASVSGDVVTIGCHLSDEEKARVSGSIHSEEDAFFPIRFELGRSFPGVWITHYPTIWGILGLLFSVFLLSALAIGLVAIWPAGAERTARVLVRQPWASGGMGCLALIIAPITLILFAITVILIPVTVMGFLGLALFTLFGWIALGLVIGQRLAVALRQDWHPAMMAGTGTFLLSLVAFGISRTVICVGWMVPFLISLLGLGAVILALFGGGTTRASLATVTVTTGAESPSIVEPPAPTDPPVPIAPSAPQPPSETPTN